MHVDTANITDIMNSFIDSTIRIFKIFLDNKTKFNKTNVYINSNNCTHMDITSINYFEGDVDGMFLLCTPNTLTLDLVSNFLDTKLRVINNTAIEGISEISRIITDNARKTCMNSLNINLKVTQPIIFSIKKHPLNIEKFDISPIGVSYNVIRNDYSDLFNIEFVYKMDKNTLNL